MFLFWVVLMVRYSQMALEVLIAFNETFNFVDQIINYVCSVIVDFLGGFICLFVY